MTQRCIECRNFAFYTKPGAGVSGFGACARCGTPWKNFSPVFERACPMFARDDIADIGAREAQLRDYRAKFHAAVQAVAAKREAQCSI
jgi:hypothetical protein